MGRRPHVAIQPNAAHIKSLQGFADLYRISDLAVIAGMSQKSLYRLIRAGRLQAWGGRGYLRARLSDLLKPYVPGPAVPIDARRGTEHGSTTPAITRKPKQKPRAAERRLGKPQGEKQP